MRAGLLDGCTTSVDKLEAATASLAANGGGGASQRAGAELAQFWRGLASCVVRGSGGTREAGRVDLLGCRVSEDPAEGAALLQVGWQCL